MTWQPLCHEQPRPYYWPQRYELSYEITWIIYKPNCKNSFFNLPICHEMTPSWYDTMAHNRYFPDTIPPDTVNIHFIENPFLPFWRQTLNLYVWAFSRNSHHFSICGCYLYEKTIELSYSRFKFGAHKKPYGPPLVWRALSRHSDCSRRSNIAQYILEWHMMYIRQ